MDIIEKIFISPVKARTDGCDQRGVIAETDDKKYYCLFYAGASHGFNKIAEGYKGAIGAHIAELENHFEVIEKTSRKGRKFFQALASQY